jgi:hypothetical protein
MQIVPNKKELPSLLLLLVLIAALVFIYFKPHYISSSLSHNNIDHLIYSNNYKLDLSIEEKNGYVKTQKLRWE